MDKIVRNKLISMSEEKYREFSEKLIPGCENILGVRVPFIRKYAKELVKENTDWQKLLEEDDIYFEETMIRGFVIGIATAKEGDIKLAKKMLNEFVLCIDNWSVNDGFCKEFRIMDKHHDEFIKDIEKMICSKKEYIARAGLILLLEHYVKIDIEGNKITRKKVVEKYDIEELVSDNNVEKQEAFLHNAEGYINNGINCQGYCKDNEHQEYVHIESGKYTDKILELVNRNFSKNGYYTQMAAGWLIAELFVVYPGAVWRFLLDKENLKLDEVSYKKAIRKICESKTPSNELKEYIRKVCYKKDEKIQKSC